MSQGDPVELTLQLPEIASPLDEVTNFSTSRALNDGA
jgi:hypothetical protein